MLLTFLKKPSMFGSNMSLDLDIKKQIIVIGQKLAKRGMVAGSDGNISARLDKTHIVITASGKAKGFLTVGDLVIVDMEGMVIEGNCQPSSELAMHLAVYHKRPEINACVHAHPPYATSFAVVGIRLEKDILPEVVVFVGAIPLIKYAPPGTEAVPEALAPHLEGNNAFLLSNHGLLTIGRTLEEAYQRHETVEQYAKIVHLAHQLGEIRHIPAEDYSRLDELRRQLEKYPSDND